VTEVRHQSVAWCGLGDEVVRFVGQTTTPSAWSENPGMVP